MFSLMMASGRPKRVLQVEVDLERQRLALPPRRPVVGPEPQRQRRRRSDRAAGERARPPRRPRTGGCRSPPTPARPQVAPLDREVGGLLVLRAPDQLGHVGRGVTRSLGRSRHDSRMPAGGRSSPGDSPAPGQQVVGVGLAGVAHRRASSGRSMPASTGATWRKVPCSGASPWRRRPERRAGDPRPPRAPTAQEPRRCRRRPAGRPTRRESACANTAARSALMRPGRRRRSARRPTAEAPGPTQVGPEPRLDRRHRQPPAVGRAVDVVARVAAGEQPVAGAGNDARGQVLVDLQRHERQHPVGHGHVEVGALPGRRPGRPGRRGWRSPPASRRRRCRRRSPPGSAACRRGRAPSSRESRSRPGSRGRGRPARRAARTGRSRSSSSRRCEGCAPGRRRSRCPAWPPHPDESSR